MTNETTPVPATAIQVVRDRLNESRYAIAPDVSVLAIAVFVTEALASDGWLRDPTQRAEAKANP